MYSFQWCVDDVICICGELSTGKLNFEKETEK